MQVKDEEHVNTISQREREKRIIFLLAFFSILPSFMACMLKCSIPVRKQTPLYLFDWGKGRRAAEQKPSPKYHDIDLPFPQSLVAKTHLRGNPFSHYFHFI